MADWNKGVKYREILIFGCHKFFNYTVLTDRCGGALHSGTTTAEVINRNPLVPFILVGLWMLAITNKDLMMCLVLKKLGIHGQEFRSKSVWLTLTMHLLAVEKLAAIFPFSYLFRRSQWPHGLWCVSGDSCLLRLRFRNSGVWIFSFVRILCVLSSRGLSVQSIARPETTYLMLCLWMLSRHLKDGEAYAHVGCRGTKEK